MIDRRETPATEERMLADDARVLRGLYAGKVQPEHAGDHLRRPSRPGALTAALNGYRAGRPDAAIGAVEAPTRRH
ncbi:hypothetical protein ABT202_35435 [Streptomyces sp900105245]